MSESLTPTMYWTCKKQKFYIDFLYYNDTIVVHLKKSTGLTGSVWTEPNQALDQPVLVQCNDTILGFGPV